MAGEWTLGEIARLVGGELTGDPAVSVRALAPLERAEAGDLSFVVSSRHAGAAAHQLQHRLMLNSRNRIAAR